VAELLLELLSEEIPARMQDRAADDLKRLVGDFLKREELPFSGIETYSTPRRLVLVVDGLPTKIPDIKKEIRGPKADAPDKAVNGFCKANSVSKNDLEIQPTDKGDFYFAVIEKKGWQTIEFVPLIVEGAIFNLSWPKSMRWGNSSLDWVRPIHSILAIFDGKLVEGTVQLGTSYKIAGLRSGPPEPDEMEIYFVSKTTGHRFMAPDAITVTGFADYRAKLRSAYVMLDAAERRTVIEKDAAMAAEGEGYSLKPDPGLIAEVAGLVEWPVVLTGAIDPAFMDLPAEVLTTSMRHHLKTFALLDGDGHLAPRFVVVANNHATDGGKQIAAGNERVLRARLSDAKFFWDKDRERTLESRVSDLDKVVFHAKLGSVGDKVERIEALAEYIVGEISTSTFQWTEFGDAAVQETEDKENALERDVNIAAQLCKTDLTSEMVGEFPELQGVMGRYYAKAEGKDKAVADAIAEHYSPQGPNDDCPSNPASVVVALADKIDSLVGFWAIDEKPTGSKDPFALRRAALGVIRLIIENKLRLSLREVIERARELHDQTQSSELESQIIDADDGVIARDEVGPLAIFQSSDDATTDLLDFFADRLKVHLKEKGVRHDLIAAVFALGGEDDLVRLLARVNALQGFLGGEDGEHLLTAYKRAVNIVRIEEKRDGVTYDGSEVDRDRLQEKDEIAVAARLIEVSGLADESLDKEKFANAMTALALLRMPVDSFFDNVTVNCDDAKLRRNRLSLLASIRATLDRVADFSKIEGGER